MSLKIENKFVKKLWITSAFYEVKAFSPYIVSLVATIRALELIKIPWEYREISGDSYVDRAKNTLLNNFLDDQEATHLFMIDSDHGWTPDAFLRVLRAAMLGAELVGASYPCKNNWDFFGCVPKMQEHEGINYHIGEEIEVEIEGKPETIRLLEMYCIPGGFVCYSKAALKRTEPALKIYQQLDLGTQEMVSFIEFFRCNIEEDGGRIGEDVYFQKRFSEMGGKILMEPNAKIAHFGIQKWEGNYHEKLLKEKAAIENETSMASAMDSIVANISNLQEVAKQMEDPAYVETLKAKIKERSCASA